MADFSTIVFLLSILPAVVGIIAVLKYKKGNMWMYVGVGLTIFIFAFKPIKFNSGYSPAVQQSFDTVRESTDKETFKASVDQRNHSDLRVEQLEEAKEQFDKRAKE